ncbi:syntaxin, putative, partial [Ixodes scapularis]
PKTRGKFSLRRVEVAVHRIVEVAIPYHLDILAKHRDNIEKFQKLKQWDKLHVEQINASRTVQQLKADLYELDHVRSQVQPENLKQFEKLVFPMQEEALQKVRTFTAMLRILEVHNRKCIEHNIFSLDKHLSRFISFLSFFFTAYELSSELLIGEVYLSETATYASYLVQTLETDLLDVSGLLTSFRQLVYEQREQVQSIEAHVTAADENVQQGTKHLIRASQLQRTLLPVTGALLGLALGGPVGMVVGAKMAFGCALGGSILGFTGGRALQRRGRPKDDTVVEVELKDLSTKSTLYSD